MTKEQATREALELALEALETNNKAWKNLADSGDAGFWEAEEQPFYEIAVKAIIAIKEALAHPEQEPVAFICQGNVYMADDVDEYCTAKHIPLYTKEQL